ncbi:MAG: hypothetical protein M1839_000513 [Geoglossum umbratile]|nr:MAG: hypothetical protein M1839_000513 [Geoglossum umbratile]
MPGPRALPIIRLLRRPLSTHTKPGKAAAVLEKPAKFNPPSHGSRRAAPRSYPGPPLSAKEKAAQQTNKYPNMMPGEGTFMRWFLTNRGLHVYITLTTLFLLATFTFLTNFRNSTPFAHLLPPLSDFPTSPLSFISTYIEVFKLHTAHESARAAERRRQKVEDVQKRSQYRKAHGLDGGEGFGSWTARTEEDAIGPSGGGEEARKRPPVKKWLGIW